MRKIISKLFATFTILCLLVPYANVKAIDVGSVGSISTGGVTAAASTAMNTMLNNLGVNQDALKNQISTLNVSQNKEQPPQVSLDFSPIDPTEGQKVTATASTMYFMNDGTKLYYTWYLQRGGCKLKSSGAANDPCNLNGDDKVDVEDYKIAAARIMVSSGFDWNKALGSDNLNCSGGAANPDYCSLADQYNNVPPIAQNYDTTPPIGGADQQGKNNPCYVYSTSSGNTYQLSADGCHHLFPGKYTLDANGNINSVSGGYLSADGSAQGSRERFWHTDPGNPDTAGNGETNEAAITGVGMNKFSWTYKTGDKVGVIVEGVYIMPTQTYDSSYKTMWAIPDLSCTDGDLSLRGATPDYATNTDNTVCNPTDPANATAFAVEPDPLPVATCTQTQQTGAGHDNTAAFATNTTTTTTTTTTTYACTWTPNNIMDPTGAGTCAYPGYATSPKTPDSTNVSGPTTVNNQTQDYNISSSNPIEACLESKDGLDKNLLAPTDSGLSGKLDVSLSSLPASPLNDPSGSDSDELDVTSSVLNSNDPAALKYSWQVYTGDDIASDNWSGPLLKSALPDVAQTSGVGLADFKFKLAFPEPVSKYLKITLRVEEDSPTGTTRSGYAETVVPISSSSNKISVYSVSASTSDLGAVTMGSTERCTDSLDKVVCPVVKDEIVGLKTSSTSLTNILWTLDGKPITPISPNCLSGDCKSATGEATNYAYFPVLKDVGEQYSVNLTANTASGDKVSVTRAFEVAEPEATITSEYQLSSDYPKIACSSKYSICPEYLGSYVDLAGGDWPDYSDNSFVAVSGQTLTLKPTTNVPSVQNAQWFIDGVEATSLGATVDADGTLHFTANKLPGEIYSIVYGATYSQDPGIKKILNASFSVPMNGFYEAPVGATVRVTMASSLSNNVAMQGSTGHKILASLVTDVPAYINFLFRIVLTTMLILFTSWILLALVPRHEEN